MRNDTKNQKPFRPLVYICSPFSGDVEGNTERTRQFCRFALEHGQIPLAPHLMFPQFVNDEDPEERNLALFMDIVLQGKCQVLQFCGAIDGQLLLVHQPMERQFQAGKQGPPDDGLVGRVLRRVIYLKRHIRIGQRGIFRQNAGAAGPF